VYRSREALREISDSRGRPRASPIRSSFQTGLAPLMSLARRRVHCAGDEGNQVVGQKCDRDGWNYPTDHCGANNPATIASRARRIAFVTGHEQPNQTDLTRRDTAPLVPTRWRERPRLVGGDLFYKARDGVNTFFRSPCRASIQPDIKI